MTPLNINRTVTSSGSNMLIDPSGRYAYLLGTFNYRPSDNHIDTFAIDQTTGALSNLGTPVLVQAPLRSLASDASGKFLFVGSNKPAGTFDPAAPINGSTLVIEQTGPNMGQPSAPGAGAGVASFGMVVFE